MPQFVLSVHCVTLLLSLLSQLHSIAALHYYFPDGTDAPADTPCNGTASVSHRCEEGAACLTSGLCYQSYHQAIDTGTCTGKTWKDPSCFQQCPKSANYKTSNRNTLYRCDLNYWCCSAGGNETSCCNDPNIASFDTARLKLPAAIYNGSALAPGFTVAPVQALETKSGIITPSDSIVNQPNSIHGTISSLNPTTIVGIGVGLGVGIPLLVALSSVSFLLLLERRRSRKITRAINKGHQSGAQRPCDDVLVMSEGKAVPHLLSSDVTAELGGM